MLHIQICLDTAILFLLYLALVVQTKGHFGQTPTSKSFSCKLKYSSEHGQTMARSVKWWLWLSYFTQVNGELETVRPVSGIRLQQVGRSITLTN